MEFRLVKYLDNENKEVESHPLSMIGKVEFDTIGIYNERNDEGLQYFEDEIHPETFEKLVQAYVKL